jgi:hypothetical protein
MDEEYLKHLLELEYEHSQRAIDKFDEYRARLKGWMITAAAGVATVGFTVRSPEIFWAGGLMILFFGLSEMYYIDIQEDAIARNRELEKLLDRLLKSGVKPEHEAYEFGLGKVFGGGRMLKTKESQVLGIVQDLQPISLRRPSWSHDYRCYHCYDGWEIIVDGSLAFSGEAIQYHISETSDAAGSIGPDSGFQA